MTLMILGNGISRLMHKERIRQHEGEVWICNRTFLELDEIPNVTVVASMHRTVAREAVAHREKHGLDYRVLTCGNMETIKGCEPFCLPRCDLSSGLLLVQEAATAGYKKAILIGFDLGGKSTHGGTVPLGRFRKDMETVLREYPDIELEVIP